MIGRGPVCPVLLGAIYSLGEGPWPQTASPSVPANASCVGSVCAWWRPAGTSKIPRGRCSVGANTFPDPAMVPKGET